MTNKEEKNKEFVGMSVDKGEFEARLVQNEIVKGFSPQKDTWVERFEERFTGTRCNCMLDDHKLNGNCPTRTRFYEFTYPAIKSFLLQEIKTAIEGERQRIRGVVVDFEPLRVTGALRTEQVYYETGYNQAISDVTQLLEGKE